MRIPLVVGKGGGADFSQPLALLSECHRRIEHFFNIFIVVNRQAAGSPLTSDQRTALQAALKYFREAAPLHTRDEEESLFPRMRACRRSEVQDRIDALDSLNADHQMMRAGHDDVDTWMNRWLTQNALESAIVKEMSDTLDGMNTIYTRHIALEDTDIFPLAGRVLEPQELLEVGREMATRRGLAARAPGRSQG